MTGPVNHAEAVGIAEAAAKETVRETFRLLGVDIDDQQSVNSFRADLTHSHRTRKLAEKGVLALVWSIIAGGGGGILFLLWDGIKVAFGGHVP